MAGDGSWDHLASMVEGAFDLDRTGICICGIDGGLLYVNRPFIEIFDREKNDGQSFKKISDISEVFTEIIALVKKEKAIRNRELTIKTESKSTRFLSCTACIHDGDGDGKSAAVIIIRDVSEKNRMEKEILRARKLEAIGILAGGIAHDYNNALTAILGNISLAKMEVGPDNNSLLEVLNDAEEASLKAVELTRHLSTFARGGKPEREVIDYKDSLRIIVDNVLDGYSGSYELVVKDDLWSVDIDEFQINKVIMYILNNAVESMQSPGAIRIIAENAVVEKEESHHEITLQPGKYVRISIHDEGAGIPAEDIYNIFDPYFTTKEMSSGMGLATSYAIIKRHHGYIDVKSSPGKGSMFSVYLPVAQ